MGLVPLRVAIWGPFVLLNFETENLLQQESQSNIVGDEWLGSSSELLSTRINDSSLKFLCRHEYTINCNWKVCNLHLSVEISDLGFTFLHLLFSQMRSPYQAGVFPVPFYSV